MIVCFFRHGPAIEAGTPPYTEENRPLTEAGRKKTLQAARGLRRLKLASDAVLTSPLIRARETAEILAEVLELPRPQLSDRLLPGVPASQLLEILRETAAPSPILVGHEPSLSAALALFVGAQDSASLEFRKAGAGVARLRTLSPRPRGTLLQFLSGSLLRRLAK